MRVFHASVAAIFAIVLGASHVASSAPRESFDMGVLTPPSPVTIDGREWLIYELHLTNFSREALRLTQLEVLASKTATLRSFEGDDLAQRVAIAAASRADTQPVKPGERAIVYLEVPLSPGSPPRFIQHRVHYAIADSQEVADVVGGETKLSDKARLALAPPLRGGPWSAVYAWEWPRGHRRVFYTLDGHARLPGRLAIDWVRRDENGNSSRGDADIVENSLGYGADVLAVANARVTAVRTDVTESDRVSTNPKHALDEKSGNYIALDLGDGRFAIYEHLKPGSIRVAPGDRVRRGQVIASLGFTGDSTEPHLHFHVADSPSPLAGEGLPFEFDLKGKRARPAPNVVVTFD